MLGRATRLSCSEERTPTLLWSRSLPREALPFCAKTQGSLRSPLRLLRDAATLVATGYLVQRMSIVSCGTLYFDRALDWVEGLRKSRY